MDLFLDHKDLFPLDFYDIAGTTLICVGLMIAAAGGIGGGGILVPLLILVMNFQPKFAVALSNFTILGSSITNMVLNFSKTHPEANRPLVDWDLILVMEPLTMAGAIIGAIVGKIIPDYVLVVLLVILLAYTSQNTLYKAKSQYEKETIDMEKAKKSYISTVHEKSEEEMEKAENEELLGEMKAQETKSQEQQTKETEIALIDLNTKPAQPVDPVEIELQNLLAEEVNTPMNRVWLITVMVVGVIVLNLVKMGVSCGTQSYWIITSLVFVWVIGFSIYSRNELIKKYKLKKRLRYKYLKGDVEWNERNTIIYPVLVFFAGLCAGMFGIGGGIVKGPLMLEMGVHPQVASGTAAVMIMFTSVAATTMFIAFGTLTWDYGIFLFVLGLLFTCIGQFVVSNLVKKTGRNSYISMSIGAVVALSTILMSIQSVFTLVDSQEGHNHSSSTSLCSK